MRGAVLAGVAVVLAALRALPAYAEPPRLALPVDCTLGEDCYIQALVDIDPGPGVQDYQCQGLTRDGHKGVDVGIYTLGAMRAGVPVVAAAAGTVLGVRDEMPDTGVTADTRDSVKGRECGNGVVLDHGGGWQTQYCHLRLGSVAVSKGQTVSRGTVLGMVGMSGKATFPHVHFSVRYRGKVVDPFDRRVAKTCRDEDRASLWIDEPDYRPGNVLFAGFAPGIPKYSDIKEGTAGHATLTRTAPGLVLWMFGFSGAKGDRVEFEITGPGGFRFFHVAEIDKDQPLYSRSAGKRRRNAGWPTGTYDGSVRLVRNGQVMGVQTATVRIK
ncbi:MAG: peptidase M24 [Rhodobacterales bacterium]|nr:MAG: peptidase M24 [Rhodobacterales bacterium]